MEKWIIAIIVGIASLYLIRRIWGTMTAPPAGACGCGCSGCHAAASCDKGDDAVHRLDRCDTSADES